MASVQLPAGIDRSGVVSETRVRLAHTRQVTLLDLLDRLLGGGVVVGGEIMLAAADIDLVALDLGLLVASVDKLSGRRPGGPQPAGSSPRIAGREARAVRRRDPRPSPRLPDRVNTDSERLEKGLAQLVLTLVELLRQLMERQALRRIDAGTLTDDEVERLGRTFLALAERMDELKESFGSDRPGPEPEPGSPRGPDVRKEPGMPPLQQRYYDILMETVSKRPYPSHQLLNRLEATIFTLSRSSSTSTC